MPHLPVVSGDEFVRQDHPYRSFHYQYQQVLCDYPAETSFGDVGNPI